MKIFLCLVFLFTYKLIYCNKDISCFEYSCEICLSEEYGNCKICKDTFLLVKGTCPCEDFGCALCSNGLVGSTCYLCKDGYVLNNNNCECKQENCEICGKDKCIKCNRGYSYNESNNQCEKNECLIPNCEYCTINEEPDICYKCKDGYYYDNGNCIEITNQKEEIEFEQCPKQDEYEFYTYCDVKCKGYGCDIKTNIMNYKFCSSNDCLVCIDDILYLGTYCKSDICNIEGCNICLTASECARCDRGYKIDLGLCTKCIEGCSVCSNNYTCDYCLSGYELDSQKQCIFTKSFNFNITEYKQIKQNLNKENNPVEEYKDKDEDDKNNINNCINYGTKGECLECKSRYYLHNNKCYMCSDYNCIKCQVENNEEICKKCRDIYYTKYNSKFCYYPKKCSVSNCEQCYSNDDSYCLRCKFKYTEVEGKCLLQTEISDMNRKNETVLNKESKKKNFDYVIYIILCSFIFIFLFSLTCYLIKKFKKRQIRENIEDMQNVQNVNIQNNNANFNSDRKKIKEKSLENEFYAYKKNDITSSVVNECNICFKPKKYLANFKCGCALLVCKECYIKCKTISNKCPGCRAII